MATTIRCALLAEGDQAALRLMKRILEPQVEVVAMADNVISLTDALEEFTPQMAVVAASALTRPFIKLIRHIASRFAPLHIIVIGVDEDSVLVNEVLNAGSCAYVLKGAMTVDLPRAADALIQGCKAGDPASPTNGRTGGSTKPRSGSGEAHP